MSALAGLDFLPERAARADAPAADTRPEPGLLEQAAAAMRVQADTVYEVQEGRKGRAYQPLIEALLERGLSREYLFKGGSFIPGADIASGIDLPNYDTVFREAQRLGITVEGSEGLPATREEFEREAFRRNGGRDADQAVMARGAGVASTVAQFGGGMVGSFRDPVNLVTLPFGGGGRTAAQRILSEALVGAAAATVSLPGTSRAYERMGEDFTVTDAALEVSLAAAGGAAVRGGIELAPKVAGAVDGAAYRAAEPVRRRIDDFFADRDLARAFADQVPENLRTPDQVAALRILAREAEIDEASPYVRTIAGDEAHRANVARAVETLDRPVADFSMSRYLQRNRTAESGGNDAAAAATSSAYGRFQFLKDTWLEFYRRTFGDTGESPAQILAKRANGTVQDRVMRTFTELNVRALRSAGLPVDDGTAYLAHFLGLGDAIKVLQAAPDAPIARLVDADSLRANPAVFGQVSSASELVAWARRKMGQQGEGMPARPEDGSGWDGLELGDDLPVIRPEALDAERPFVSSAGREIPIGTFRPAEIGVDAELMQFKSGGDQFGVTDRLQGVQEWDPVAAGLVTVWEGADGRRLIADGHQRLGLAKRAEASGAEVSLNAFVLREADGFSARDARIITALKNMGEGTGTAADAAKVLREAGEAFEEMIERRLPPKSALVRDGKALARLSDEAFGAVVNEVIPESHAAAIGHLAPDPTTHMALVELLAATEPANRRQAEAILRQALEAGFTRETQDELFGTRELTSALFLQRARLLDKTLLELKRLKGAFGVAARNADALEGAGNTIDVAGSEAAAASNATALALVERLALRKGNAVNALIVQAAERLAGGEPLARVTRDVVRQIRELDLADLERAGAGAGDAGDGTFGAGRASEPAGETDADAGPLTPNQIDELVAEQDLGPSLFEEGAPAARAFDDDAGDGVKAATESDWHDIRAGQDPNIAKRQRQEAELGAAAPMRAGVEQDGTMGSPLFDRADQPTFDLDDGKGPRTAAEIEAEIAAERAGLEAIRKCLI